MRMRVALLVAAALVRCGAAPEPRSGADCNAHLWPRVIVDVETSARVRVRLPDGRILEGNPGGCPAFPDVRCSYSFFTAPADREIVLMAEANGRAAERRIVMPPFTREGRNIVYVIVSPAPGIGEPRILSPC